MRRKYILFFCVLAFLASVLSVLSPSEDIVHVHNYKTETVPPTCLDGGYTVYSCICGDSYKYDFVSPLGHLPEDDFTVVRQPTVYGNGLKVKKCLRCGEIAQSEETDALPYIFSSSVFSDVKKGAWYEGAVDFVLSSDLMNGVSDTEFEPNGVMTRAMLVTVLWRLEGEPGNYINLFSDIGKGKWFRDAVCWAEQNGIVNGVGESRFAPDSPVTREMCAAILFRYVSYLGSDTSASKDISLFPDYMKVHTWASDAVCWAYGEGIIRGNTDNKGRTVLDPEGDTTRAMLASVFMRYLSEEKNLHSWDAGETILNSTCAEKGTVKYICNHCGNVKLTALSPLGHIHTNEITVREATCTEKGKIRYFCTRCSSEITEATPSLGHSYKSATCTDAAECIRCGSRKGNPLGHKWGNGIYTKFETCTESGSKTFVCERCGETKKETVPPRGHDFADGVITKIATYTSFGEITYVCRRCFFEKKEALPKASDENVPGSERYVINISTKKFHLPTCYHVSSLSKEKRVDVTARRSSLIYMGYEPCGHCSP